VLPINQTLWRRLAPLHVQWMILPVSIVRKPAAVESGCLFRFVTQH
jgi:hypothetical protein